MIPHHRAISRALGACCALTLLVSACASSGDDATSGPQSDASERYVGPLDTFLGLGNGNERTEAELAEEARQRREVEQLTATCMREQGFEYVPVDRPDEGRGFKDSIRALSPAQFAAQYGYGMTTIDRATIDNGWVNPNDAIVNAMTVAQRAAYFTAMYGDLFTLGLDGYPIKSEKDRNTPPSATSCAAQADTAVFGPLADGGSTTQDSFAALQESIRALFTRVDEDPRLSPPRSAWIDCMAAAGHPGYTEMSDGQREVDERAQAAGADKKAAQVEPAALSELRAFEISVATADYECRREFDVVLQTVSTELEQAFIEANRVELEQFRDALAAGTAHVSKG